MHRPICGPFSASIHREKKGGAPTTTSGRMKKKRKSTGKEGGGEEETLTLKGRLFLSCAKKGENVRDIDATIEKGRRGEFFQGGEE